VLQDLLNRLYGCWRSGDCEPEGRERAKKRIKGTETELERNVRAFRAEIENFFPAKLPHIAHAAEVRAKQDIKSLIHYCSCEAGESISIPANA